MRIRAAKRLYGVLVDLIETIIQPRVFGLGWRTLIQEMTPTPGNPDPSNQGSFIRDTKDHRNYLYLSGCFFHNGLFSKKNLKYNPSEEDGFRVPRNIGPMDPADDPGQVPLDQMERLVGTVNLRTHHAAETLTIYLRLLGVSETAIEVAQKLARENLKNPKYIRWSSRPELPESLRKKCDEVEYLDLMVCIYCVMVPRRYWNAEELGNGPGTLFSPLRFQYIYQKAMNTMT
jgi:hypothetical protein